MSVERVAGSPWNQWPDVHGMGGRMPVESALAGTAGVCANPFTAAFEHLFGTALMLIVTLSIA